jgi:hypothetical protein
MLVTYKQLLQEVVSRAICSDREYKRPLKQIERLMHAAHKTRAEDDMIELLGILIEQYEVRLGYTDPVLSPRDRLAGLMEARREGFKKYLEAVPDVPSDEHDRLE